ncbi:MAG: hypothetical protein ACI83W_000025 [Marinoscillum sp.]|jgi:hypothetical protein
MVKRKFRKGQFFILGIAIGTALGVSTENLAIWIGVGAGLGVAIDAVLTRRNSDS